MSEYIEVKGAQAVLKKDETGRWSVWDFGAERDMFTFEEDDASRARTIATVFLRGYALGMREGTEAGRQEKVAELRSCLGIP